MTKKVLVDRRKGIRPITTAKFALMTEILKDERQIEWIANKHNVSTHHVYKLRVLLDVHKPHKRKNNIQ